MKCPACNEDLLMTERMAVQIDYCPKCRGIWLEKGKLDKIIEQSNIQNKQIYEHKDHYKNGHHHDDDDYDEHHRKKKKGFLENLFD